MMIPKHFFKDLNQWIGEMKDPRNSSYTVYTPADYIYMGILKNICPIGSMRQMDERFNEETCIHTLKIQSGNQELVEMPHYDSLNHYLERLSLQELSGLRRKMVKTLLRGKQFYRGRLLGKYRRVDTVGGYPDIACQTGKNQVITQCCDRSGKLCDSFGGAALTDFPSVQAVLQNAESGDFHVYG